MCEELQDCYSYNIFDPKYEQSIQNDLDFYETVYNDAYTEDYFRRYMEIMNDPNYPRMFKFEVVE